MIKEGIEDLARHRADDVINHTTAHVFRDGSFVDMHWKEIMVGDVIKVSNKENVPADFVVIASSGHRGVCYIETSNLDG